MIECGLLFLLYFWIFRSPNGPGLMVWPEYGAEAEYLGIGAQQKPGKNLKGKHVTFLTETLPELVRLGQKKQEL